MKVCIAVVLLAVAGSACAQDRIATSLFISGAIADDVTTWRNVNAGHQESNPAYAFTKTQPTGVVISLVITDAVTLWLAHRYTQTHPKLVKTVLFTLGSVRIAEAANNAHRWYLDTHQPVFVPDPH